MEKVEIQGVFVYLVFSRFGSDGAGDLDMDGFIVKQIFTTLSTSWFCNLIIPHVEEGVVPTPSLPVTLASV